MSATLSVSATRPRVKHPAESILFGVDFSPLLLPSEAVLSVSSVSATPSGLTINNVTVNPSPFPNGEGGIVEIAQGAQFRAAGGTAGSDYTLVVTVTTTIGNIRVVVCSLQVRDA